MKGGQAAHSRCKGQRTSMTKIYIMLMREHWDGRTGKRSVTSEIRRKARLCDSALVGKIHSMLKSS